MTDDATDDEKTRNQVRHIKDTAAGVKEVFKSLVAGEKVHHGDLPDLAIGTLLLEQYADEVELAARKAAGAAADAAYREKLRKRDAAKPEKVLKVTKADRKRGVVEVGLRDARPAKPSPVDRHIERASKAVAPRRGRAPSAGTPCAPGSPRHRFGGDGGCRVTGCSVKRATKGGAPSADPEPAPAAPVPPPAAPPAATKPAKPPKRMTIELPDGTKMSAGVDLPAPVHYVPKGREVADCGVKASWATPADAAARTTIADDVTCTNCLAVA